MRLKRQLTSCIYGLAFCVSLVAQTNTTAQSPATQDQAVVDPNRTQFPHDQKTPPSELVPATSETPLLWNGYETHFAVEFGGRALSNTGNSDVYATFVNLQPGVRL